MFPFKAGDVVSLIFEALHTSGGDFSPTVSASRADNAPTARSLLIDSSNSTAGAVSFGFG